MIPSALSTLTKQASVDFTVCDGWYSFPTIPTVTDCIRAYDDLSQGDDPVAWFTNKIPPGFHDAYMLPIVRTYGTCQIRIEPSGKYVDENAGDNIRLIAAPKVVRRKAKATIDQCIESEREGGYSTFDLDKTINWITAPTTDFPDKLDLGPELTFFTVMVWNYEPTGMNYFEPGSYDELTALHIRDAITDAAKVAPSGSELQRQLRAKAKYINESATAINDHGGNESGLTWWTGPSDGLSRIQNSSAIARFSAIARLALPGTKNCSDTPPNAVGNE